MLSTLNSAYLAQRQTRPPMRPFVVKTLTLACMVACIAINIHSATAADNLIKTLPQKAYTIPAGDLSEALPAYAAEAGVLLGFEPSLTNGKQTTGLKGQYGLTEGFSQLLKGSGLEVVNDNKGGYTLKKAVITSDDNLPLNKELSTVEVRAKRFYEIGPLPGLGLTKEQIPGNVQSITAKEIQETHALSMADLMNQNLQSVNVNDYQGNPFQMDVTYRGFTASPQIGTPQGLSVFFDGIRVNEPFGDIVNWDMIPMNALAAVDVFPGSNPIFGLGTLGGAFSMKTKDGFSNTGVDAEVLTGSFGRKQLQVSGGINNGTVGFFAAGNFFLEDGWRKNSPSKVNQIFGKASYLGDKLDLNLSTLVVSNDLVGNGLIPSEMYSQDRNGVFTSPDTTKNDLLQFQLSGSYFVNDNFTITAQAYHRKSDRKSLGADVYTEYGTQTVKRNLATGEVYTCLFNSSNQYKLPDYYVVDLQDDNLFDPNNAFVSDLLANGTPNFSLLPAGSLNKALDDPEFVKLAQAQFTANQNFLQTNILSAQAGYVPVPQSIDDKGYSGGAPNAVFITNSELTALKDDPAASALFRAQGSFYYFTPDTVAAGDLTPGDGLGVKHVIYILPPNNAATCQGDVNPAGGGNGLKPLEVPGPQGGVAQTVDGAAYGASGPGTEGVVEGTPTSVLTDTKINQIVDGASVQLNWNYDHHKFMVGASIDAPGAKYKSGQMLGLFDAERNILLAPDQIRDQYAAADQEISNNNFEGTQLTKSLYASETWSPIETLHFTGSARYNMTKGKNTIASRTFGNRVFDLAQLENFPNYYGLCINGQDCPSTGYVPPDVSKLLNAPETEKFSYYSLNPSLGATWQASSKLNLYTNWNQGTRVPSVIELGCAFDHTLVSGGSGPSGMIEKSLAENRSCSLPSTLSGDPALPQIKAQTMEFGMRGMWGSNIEWNLSAYQTDLRDDIYLVTFPGNKSFFDTIGDTRRRGIEAGMTTTFGRARLRLNYSLTDATFQNSFKMASNDNSSAVEDVAGNQDYGRSITVKPGDRMPGVPLHNLNATLSYAFTSKWQASITAVAHSMSYVRGNENNEHQPGVTTYYIDVQGFQRARLPTSNPGSVPGYMTFNFRTSYQLSSEWYLGLQVNNLLDKEYFSAGRLGRNPFSPSINGAIGRDGYNHNSADWLSTNFLAPGAPRGVWFSLNWQFDPNKK